MTDNVAILEGYTKEIVAEGQGRSCETLYLLVKPDTDLDGDFRAWDTDMQEWVRVDGCNCLIYDGHD